MTYFAIYLKKIIFIHFTTHSVHSFRLKISDITVTIDPTPGHFIDSEENHQLMEICLGL